MPRQSFQRDLNALRADVLDMGETVRSRLQQALNAIQEGDADAGRAVMKGDHAVNRQYLDLESRCIDLLALQQPVAGDLRTIVAAFKISTDLERIADLAGNLGERAAENAASRQPPPAVDLRGVGEVALTMLDDALTAFETEDAWACHEVAAADEELDALCERATTELFRHLVRDGTIRGPSERDRRTDLLLEDYLTDGTPARAKPNERAPESTDAADEEDSQPYRSIETAIADASWQLLVIRDLERAGDHAVNVAGRTLYLIEEDDALLE